MAVFTRCLLSKSDLEGWEVMELFAGAVNQSDKFFNVILSPSLCGPLGSWFSDVILVTIGIYHHPRKVARR
jgi:hypothetical protein